MRNSRIVILFAVCCVGGLACSDKKTTALADAIVDTGTDAVSGKDVKPPAIIYDRPDYFPAVEQAADEAIVLDGLSSAVRVVFDNHGVPHVYGSDVNDVIRVQGYVTARQRLFQMHTLRTVVRGELASYAGSGSLQGDVYLRILKLRPVAEQMAAAAKENEPEVHGVLQAYSDGVNAYIDAMKAGTEPEPLEVALFKLDLQPWTPTDTMSIVRLQTWDLGFGGYLDDDEVLDIGLDLKERYAGTPLEGVEQDVLRFTPPTSTPAIAKPASKPGTHAAIDWNSIWEHPFYKRLGSAHLRRMAKERKAMESIPHHRFRSADFGSNNWVVAGAHTASGHALVANDTHLSLRNPAIFHQVHLSTIAAGGDFEVSGVNFSGGPGIVLGHNRHGAWGATVFFSDVTDVYVETLDDTGSQVLFNGNWVAIDSRQETFTYVRPPDQPCSGAVSAGSWIHNLNPQFAQTASQTCTLTVTLQDVAHHGPVVPWSYGTDNDGKPMLMTWQWTGFQPTQDYSAVFRLNQATSVEEFRSALDHFGVGAQNWVWGDKEGNIAWYPSHLLPLRKHLEEGSTEFPPFLPMPGDGTTEWVGFMDRSQLPQATNPEKGYLVTANSDPLGISFDNDPFNDGTYIGFFWDAGFRMERITERLAPLVEAGGLTRDHLAAIQGDHRSNLGARITPHLIVAVKLAQSGADLAASAALPTNTGAVRTLLEEWTFEAESGVGAEAGSVAAKDSQATAIFNAFLVNLVHNTLGDEQLAGISDQLKVRLLLRMLEEPAGMVSWDSDHSQSRLWDNEDTPEVVETKTYILVKSLAEGLTFLANPGRIGVAQKGGFGTDDMSQWRWGDLHTVTLKHNVVSLYSIPPSNDPLFPTGFPRPGDNFTVDACHPGMSDTNFTYSGGPAIRNVYEPGLANPMNGVIPGGQSEDPGSPHYADEMANWVQNKTRPVPFQVEDVLAVTESIQDFVPPSAVK